jgi:hypothetical protein
MIITENGAAFPDQLEAGEQIVDSGIAKISRI